MYNINYHIVWGTKYRNKCLKGDVAVSLKYILAAIAEERGFSIPYFEVGEEDHVHLFVSAPPKLSVSTMVKWLKGESSRKLFGYYEKKLRGYYWKEEGERHLWSPSYFVESIGAANQDAVIKYISGQREKEERRRL